MAALLQLGNRVINMDLVCEVVDYGERLRLFYAVGTSDPAGVLQQAYADLDGSAAAALRAWLATHATQLPVASDAAAAMPRDAQAEGDRARLLQAALASAGAPAPDQQPASAARLRQLHGSGSDTTTGAAGSGDEG